MTLWLRVEASPEIGFGHLMRCISVAEAARNLGDTIAFVGEYSGIGRQILQRRAFVGTPTRNWPKCVMPGDVVVFDGYEFTSADHRALPPGVRKGAIDDFGTGRFDVDVLVNPNLPTTTRYDVPDAAQVLVGPQYALVREEFTARRRSRGGRRLLVTFGGSDIGAVGHDVAAWAADHRHFDVTLVLGPATPDRATHPDVDVVRSPNDVGAVFDEADVAISAAGSTTWELLSMGIPTVLVEVADNQRAVAAPLAGQGAALSLGRLPLERQRVQLALDRLTNAETRRELAARAIELVDGHGARRVLRALMREYP